MFSNKREKNIFYGRCPSSAGWALLCRWEVMSDGLCIKCFVLYYFSVLTLLLCLLTNFYFDTQVFLLLLFHSSSPVPLEMLGRVSK